jgi:hypothetical protein
MLFARHSDPPIAKTRGVARLEGPTRLEIRWRAEVTQPGLREVAQRCAIFRSA